MALFSKETQFFILGHSIYIIKLWVTWFMCSQMFRAIASLSTSFISGCNFIVLFLYGIKEINIDTNITWIKRFNIFLISTHVQRWSSYVYLSFKICLFPWLICWNGCKLGVHWWCFIFLEQLLWSWNCYVATIWISVCND